MKNSKKHLLWVHYNSESDGSFADKIISQFEFFKEQYSITFLFPKEGTFTRKIEEAGGRVLFYGLNENDGFLKYFSNCFKFIKFLKKEKVDLVYFLDFVWWKPAEVLAVKFLGIPSIAFIGFYKTSEALKGFISKLDMVVANSSATRKNLIENGLEKKSCVINNFIDLEKYNNLESIREELCREFSVDEKSKIIGYVGALHPIKGIENLLNVFSELLADQPQVHLFIAGYEKEKGYEKSLVDLVRDLNISSYVTFLGKRNDVGELMKSFDVLAVPSIDEPFGYVLIEAHACGTPVVASNVGGIPEIVLNGETGLLFEKEDEDALLNSLTQILDKPDLAKNLSVAAYKRTKENFSKEVVLEKWEELFSKYL